MTATISSIHDLLAAVERLGFLPLLESGIPGFNAEAMADDDCRYVTFDDGGWDWPLWKWKGPAIAEGNCIYGKFFASKAGFVSRLWWPELCNWRRSASAEPVAGSVEEAILLTLKEHGSMITRDLRAMCGFTGPKMRSMFDSYVTRLQMQCRIVTEDFVYPRDRHGREYGWGWALLTTPERRYGREACHSANSPDESRQLILEHLATILPQASPRQLQRIV